MKRKDTAKAIQEAATDAEAAALAGRSKPRRSALPEPVGGREEAGAPLESAPAHAMPVEQDEDGGPITWHEDASTLDD